LVEGFYSVINENWAKVFTVEEIEIAICGQSHIDINDWKKFTEYKGFRIGSTTVANFWKAMETYS
jgi:E3 ubiquitin-protein ligase NEDD4